MTKPKKVAYTLKNILNHPIMETILDKSKDINDVIDEVVGWWKYDLFKRKAAQEIELLFLLIILNIIYF